MSICSARLEPGGGDYSAIIGCSQNWLRTEIPSIYRQLLRVVFIKPICGRGLPIAANWNDYVNVSIHFFCNELTYTFQRPSGNTNHSLPIIILVVQCHQVLTDLHYFPSSFPIDWQVGCLLAGQDLWKRMPLKYSITMVFTCHLSRCKISSHFRENNDVVVFPFPFHIFMPLIWLWMKIIVFSVVNAALNLRVP